MSAARSASSMVGNGMAGVRTLEELLKLAPDAYDITVFGAEPHPNYNRILLSPVLAGEQTLDEIMLNDRDWYAANGITLHLGKEVMQIDRAQRQVIAADGTAAPYDRLLLATGSTPFILPVPGKDLPGVITYRDIADTDAMIDAATRVSPRGGHRRRTARPRSRQRPQAARHGRDRRAPDAVADGAPARPHRGADLLQKSLEAKGLAFRLEAKTEAAGRRRESGRVAAVRARRRARRCPPTSSSWRSASGPTSSSRRTAGLHCDRGIVVNDTLQTFDPRIYAIGECVSHRGIDVRPRRAAVRDGEGLRQSPRAATASAATPARRRRPSSRSPASISSPPAISPAARTPRRSCSPIRRRRLQEARARRTTSWSAACSTATPSTARGTSSCCAKGAASPRSATG